MTRHLQIAPGFTGLIYKQVCLHTWRKYNKGDGQLYCWPEHLFTVVLRLCSSLAYHILVAMRTKRIMGLFVAQWLNSSYILPTLWCGYWHINMSDPREPRTSDTFLLPKSSTAKKRIQKYLQYLGKFDNISLTAPLLSLPDEMIHSTVTHSAQRRSRLLRKRLQTILSHILFATAFDVIPPCANKSSESGIARYARRCLTP